MGHAIDEQPFPRGVLIAAAALLSFTMAAAGFARITGVGANSVAPAQIVEQRLLTLTLEKDGSVRVRDAASGSETAHIPSGRFGFIAVVLQGVTRERMRANVPYSDPLRLTRHADGRARIEDPSTGQVLSLDAFGHDNEAAFAQLFHKGPPSDQGSTAP